MAEFVVTVSRPGTSERFTRTFDQVVVVGRSPDCDIHLNDGTISRRHAELTGNDDGTLLIRDLGSVNGSTVQGKVLKADEVVVQREAMVQIGPYVLSVTSSSVTADSTQISTLGGDATMIGTAGAPPVRRAETPVPGGTQTVMFSDIDNSTPLTVKLGDRRWMEVLREHNVIVRRCIQAHNGYEVKTVGDEFMVSFQSAIDAVHCAVSIQRAMTVRNESAETPIDVHIGLHTGEPVVEDGDLFGTHINYAARIAGQAGSREVIVSELLRQLIEPSGEFQFENREPVTLKGIEGEHRLFNVEWASPREPPESDPSAH